jgi:succinate dehydrogenase/fumarate reductase flavoprotein subunit
LKNSNIERRDFLKAAGVVGAAVLSASVLSGCTDDKPAAEHLPQSWDYEADIVVVGHGGGGLSAAITSIDEGLGTVIMLEAAPEEFAGGNSRVCGQNMLIPDNPTAAIQYQRALNDIYILDEDPAVEQVLYEAWANGLHENKEWLEGLGADVTATTMNSHEFPEIPGNETGATCYLIDNTVGNSAVWNFLNEERIARNIETLYSTRATELVRDPMKNEALGVIADQDGKAVYIKAKKGIVLACGGFENDPEMMRNEWILGSMWDAVPGSPYNRGDGFRMIAPFGAKLWHMNNSLGPIWGYSGCGTDSITTTTYSTFGTKDYVFVGPDGKRFVNEESYGAMRHGKVLFGGVYQAARASSPSWTVFGQKCFEADTILKPFSMGWAYNILSLIADDNQGFLDAGVIVQADTIEELAKKMGSNSEALKKTIADYNGYCVAGKDPDFHRGEPMEKAEALFNAMGNVEETADAAKAVSEGFELIPIEGPYYATRMRPFLINTQGGPKRGPGGEVMDVFGKPVSRLYAAGEFGTIYSYQYNGGGNFSEAMSSGRIAVRSIGALTPWDQ